SHCPTSTALCRKKRCKRHVTCYDCSCRAGHDKCKNDGVTPEQRRGKRARPKGLDPIRTLPARGARGIARQLMEKQSAADPLAEAEQQRVMEEAMAHPHCRLSSEAATME
ncbi:unnamed protein product, partial [Phaeothamnion confervicola]